MIGRLRGEVIDRTATQLIVDVQGVGYVVTVTPQTHFPLNERVDLYIHTQVRDDAISLYGFADPVEKELFNLLLGVPNIGPAKAMGILKTPALTFIELVLTREPGKLAKLPGVGKKTAERILVDLADKMNGVGGSSRPVVAAASGVAATRPSGVLGDLISALVNLGFREEGAATQAEAAVEKLGQDAGLEALLREALSKPR